MDYSLALVIAGLCECVKKVGLPSKYLPLLSAILGGLLYGAMSLTLDSICMGIIQGLTVSGVISVIDRRLQKYSENKRS
jgi:hypothetical protein